MLRRLNEVAMCKSLEALAGVEVGLAFYFGFQ